MHCIALHKYYGIQKKNDHYIMGDKIIKIDEKSNITVNGEKFTASPGSWELIMLTKPAN